MIHFGIISVLKASFNHESWTKGPKAITAVIGFGWKANSGLDFRGITLSNSAEETEWRQDFISSDNYLFQVHLRGDLFLLSSRYRSFQLFVSTLSYTSLEFASLCNCVICHVKLFQAVCPACHQMTKGALNLRSIRGIFSILLGLIILSFKF